MSQMRPVTVKLCRMSIVLAGLLVSACTGRPYHSTPLDALTEFPGALTAVKNSNIRSTEILLQQQVAGGLNVLYRWQTPASQQRQTYCVAVTFVTPEGSGWRAQSTGTFVNSAGQMSNATCEYTKNHDFIAGYYPGGNIRPLTTAFGLSNQGDKVRIEWSDGKISVVPVQNGSFLDSRAEIVQVHRITLLDASGNTLNSHTL
jgi:hypothetical protein